MKQKGQAGCRSYMKGGEWYQGYDTAGLDYSDDESGAHYWRIPGLQSDMTNTKLKNVRFQLDQVQIIDKTEDSLVAFNIDNSGNDFPTLPEKQTKCSDKEVSETWSSSDSKTVEWSFNYKYTVSIEADVLFVKTKATQEFGFDYSESSTRTLTNGHTKAEREEICDEIQCYAPANKHIVCTAIISKGTIKVPFVGDEERTFDDGHTEIVQVTGDYTSTQAYDIQMQIQDITSKPSAF